MSNPTDQFERFMVTSGQTIMLAPGTYYNPQGYCGNGAVGEVQAGGTLTGSTITLFGNTALSTRSADSCGGAVVNAGTATLESAASVTFGISAAVWNGVAWSDGNFTLTTDDAKKTLLVSKLA